MAALSAATGALPTSASQRQLLPTTLAGVAGRRRDRPPEPKVGGSSPAWRIELQTRFRVSANEAEGPAGAHVALAARSRTTVTRMPHLSGLPTSPARCRGP